ncbi:helix-turn-helix domain-containing protein [Devosia sp.]|uniref:helix-turn-helix domain-containing protein n=1 Tax=Devosia sp. TaxID=1871048 RepID=UPI003A943AAC
MQPNPIPIRLKEARKRKGISQRELGIRAGMDESVASARMNQYEKGKHAPDIEILRKIAKELDVPLSYFFCDDKTSAEIVRYLEKLSEDERLNILKTIMEISARN